MRTHVLFHTDAVQAIGAISRRRECHGHAIMLSHVRPQVPWSQGRGRALHYAAACAFSSLMHGGAQERSQPRRHGERSGVSWAWAKAIELATANIRPQTQRASARLRDQLIDRILAEIPYVRLNGHRTKRLPGNVQRLLPLHRGRIAAAASGSEGHRRLPPARPARPARSIPPMCCWPSACPTRSPTARLRLSL